MSELFITVFNMSIASSWLILAVLILRLLLKKAPKRMTCIMWGLVAFRLICPFTVESALSLIPSAETLPKDIAISPAPEINSGFTALNQALNPQLTQSLAPKPYESINPMQIITAIAFSVWCVGIALLLIYLAVSCIRLSLNTREAVSCGDYMLCDRVASPFIFGIIKPKIYLPSSISSCDVPLVIAHERAHISYLDHLWKPIGFLLAALHWFNPLVWIAYCTFCRDIELACDEKVVRELDDNGKKCYSNALLNCSNRKKIPSVCPLSFGEISIKTRVRKILSYKKPTFWIIVISALAIIAVSIFFLTSPKRDIKATGIGEAQNQNIYSGNAGAADAEQITYSYMNEYGSVTFTITPKSKQYSFSMPLVSSTLSFGTYTEKDGILTLKSNGSDSAYIFIRDGNSLIYQSEGSSEIRIYANAFTLLSNSTVPNNARFEYSPVASGMEATSINYFFARARGDIDGDGKNEICTLSPGPTSGRYSLYLTVTLENGDNIKTVIYPHAAVNTPHFGKNNGRLMLYMSTQTASDARYFEISVKGSSVVLT